MARELEQKMQNLRSILGKARLLVVWCALHSDCIFIYSIVPTGRFNVYSNFCTDGCWWIRWLIKWIDQENSGPSFVTPILLSDRAFCKSSKADLVSVKEKSLTLGSLWAFLCKSLFSHLPCSVGCVYQEMKWVRNKYFGFCLTLWQTAACQLQQCFCFPRSPLGWWLPELPDKGWTVCLSDLTKRKEKKRKSIKEMFYRVA